MATITATYKVVSTTQPTLILSSSFLDLKIIFSSVVANNVSIDTSSKTYTFSSLGNKQVVFTLKTGTDLPASMFYGLDNLLSVTCNGITSIGTSAFDNCINLTIFSGPAVTFIGGSSFSGCKKLTTYTFSTITTLNSSAFANWEDNPISLTLNISGNSDIRNCFSGSNKVYLKFLNTGAFNTYISGITGLKKLELPNATSITTPIQQTGLETFTLPDLITSIPMSFLENSSELTKVDLGNGLTSIPSVSFNNCPKLKTIILGTNVNHIYEYIGSSNVEELIIKAETPPTLLQYAFDYLTNFIIRVPTNSIQAYKEAWPDYKDYIFSLKASDDNPVVTPAETKTYYNSVTPYLAVPVKKVTKQAGNIITYTAEELLLETDDEVYGIRSDRFNTSVKSHTFKNGKGIIEFYSDVTELQNYCFENSPLISIQLPDTVIEINDYAFSHSTLSSITLSNLLKTIGNWTFWDCTHLQSIDIPNTVTYIGSGAFQACTSLVFMKLPNNIETLNAPFCGCLNLERLILPKNLKSLGTQAFIAGCPKLTKITIPEKITSIPGGPFGGSSLIEIHIPQTVRTIGGGAFSLVPLTKVTFEGSTEILGGAFSGTLLTELSIPPTIKLNAGSFCDNFRLTKLYLNTKELNNLILPAIFGSCPINTLEIGPEIEVIPRSFTGQAFPLSNLHISGNCKVIRNNAFYSCPITSIVLEEGIKSIESYAFYGSSLINELIIPNSIEFIGSLAFAGRTINKIVIGKNCRHIGYTAFTGTINELIVGPNVKGEIQAFVAINGKTLKFKGKYSPEQSTSSSGNYGTFQEILVPKNYFDEYKYDLTAAGVNPNIIKPY